MWSILCQLVPFAQVVLLTAMEYLREEEEENKEEKEDSPELKGTVCEEDNSGLTTKDAWKKRSRADFVPRLMIIGKLHSM